ncbi:unnamed protein product [Cladocopium goreaui]|uniref:UPF0586 protein n=1 Tax=Cladocopium goreaui TaxID=2562237 RepID=A0A9P1DKI1_9DINO|nr:unnamed protein product [Cladocopium goreaui]
MEHNFGSCRSPKPLVTTTRPNQLSNPWFPNLWGESKVSKLFSLFSFPLSEAAECLRETLLVWRQAQDKGIGSPKDVAATLHSLGNVYRGLVDATSAQRCFSAALQIREALLGAAHPHTARTRHCLALVGCSLGTPGEALEELNLAMDGLLQNLGSKHPWTLQARLDANTLMSSRPGSAGSQNSMGI